MLRDQAARRGQVLPGIQLFRVEIRYDDGSSERQRSSFLPNSRTPFSRLLAGFSLLRRSRRSRVFFARLFRSRGGLRFGLKFRFPRNRIRRWPIFSISPVIESLMLIDISGGHLLPPLLFMAGSATSHYSPLLALGHVMAFTPITRKATHTMGFRLLA